MEGIPLALVTERSPMLELLVTGNLECIQMMQKAFGNEFERQRDSRQTEPQNVNN